LPGRTTWPTRNAKSNGRIISDNQTGDAPLEVVLRPLGVEIDSLNFVITNIAISDTTDRSSK
jgi:hypothetical protein